MKFPEMTVHGESLQQRLERLYQSTERDPFAPWGTGEPLRPRLERSLAALEQLGLDWEAAALAVSLTDYVSRSRMDEYWRDLGKQITEWTRQRSLDTLSLCYFDIESESHTQTLFHANKWMNRSDIEVTPRTHLETLWLGMKHVASIADGISEVELTRLRQIDKSPAGVLCWDLNLSGRTTAKELERIRRCQEMMPTRCERLLLAASAIMTDGAERRIHERFQKGSLGPVETLAGRRLGPKESLLSHDQLELAQRQRIHEFCRKFHKRAALSSKYKTMEPLGYDDGGWLLVTEDNCPNNSLPFLWHDEPEWGYFAPFPRVTSRAGTDHTSLGSHDLDSRNQPDNDDMAAALAFRLGVVQANASQSAQRGRPWKIWQHAVEHALSSLEPSAQSIIAKRLHDYVPQSDSDEHARRIHRGIQLIQGWLSLDGRNAVEAREHCEAASNLRRHKRPETELDQFLDDQQQRLSERLIVKRVFAPPAKAPIAADAAIPASKDLPAPTWTYDGPWPDDMDRWLKKFLDSDPPPRVNLIGLPGTCKTTLLDIFSQQLGPSFLPIKIHCAAISVVSRDFVVTEAIRQLGGEPVAAMNPDGDSRNIHALRRLLGKRRPLFLIDDADLLGNGLPKSTGLELLLCIKSLNDNLRAIAILTSMLPIQPFFVASPLHGSLPHVELWPLRFHGPARRSKYPGWEDWIQSQYTRLAKTEGLSGRTIQDIRALAKGHPGALRTLFREARSGATWAQISVELEIIHGWVGQVICQRSPNDVRKQLRSLSQPASGSLESSGRTIRALIDLQILQTTSDNRVVAANSDWIAAWDEES